MASASQPTSRLRGFAILYAACVLFTVLFLVVMVAGYGVAFREALVSGGVLAALSAVLCAIAVGVSR